jgi:hypothetical protein
VYQASPLKLDRTDTPPQRSGRAFQMKILHSLGGIFEVRVDGTYESEAAHA